MLPQPTNPSVQPQATTATNLTLLTFKVAGQLYGVPVEKIIRIIEMVTITHLPEAPESIKGIINLHGQAVPVMDLRARFGLAHATYGLHTPIILVDATGNTPTSQPLALVVDHVQEVVDVTTEGVQAITVVEPTTQPHPDLADPQRGSYLAGMVNVDRQMIVLLNIAALLRPHERASLLTVGPDKVFR